MARGGDVALYGCDIEPLDFRAFYDFAGLQYTQLKHPSRLPYDDNLFDVVIGSGVLEHVPNDSECLKELWRIIRPGGVLVITFLPNRYSYTEWLNRRLGNPHHLRLYTRAEAVHMLMHHGFLTEEAGYHQVIPTLSGPGGGGIFESAAANRLVNLLFSANARLEKLWPIKLLSTNIFVIGRKVLGFNDG
jgi:SAM-dependent methyltransferase